MAEKIVSPGVFTRENDLSFLAQGVGNIGAAIIGPFKKGPVFLPTIVNTQSEFEQIFGTPDGSYYTGYTVQNYLRESGTVTIVRVGHIGGYTHTDAIAIGVSGSTGTKLIGSLFSTVNGTEITGFPAASNQITSQASASAFTIDGTELGITTPLSASIDPTQANDISNVFGTSALGTKNAYVYNYFETEAAKQVQILTSSGSSVEYINLPVQDFSNDAQVANTPYIQSQLISGQRYDLFRFHTLGAGNSSNQEYKVAISNIKRTRLSDGSEGWPTFTVTVREFGDSDRRPTFLENYSGVNLDPSSANNIARRIGNLNVTIDPSGKQIITGDFQNNSNYIRVEVKDDGSFPSDALPFGHGAYINPLFVGTVGDYTDSSVPAVIYSTGSINNSGNSSTNFAGIQLDTAGIKVDNKSYLSPIPKSATIGSNTSFSFDAPITAVVNGLVSTYNFGFTMGNINSFNNQTLNSQRQFIIGFQNGFDGISPTVKSMLGESITGTNSQGFDLSSSTASGSVAYQKAINSVSNPDDFDINLVSVPGVIRSEHPSTFDSIVNMVESREDAFFIGDVVGTNSTIGDAIAQGGFVDSSYVGTYYPWVKTIDVNTNRLVSVPPSVLMPGIYASNDAVSAEWWAPAGLNRGGIVGAVSVLNRLTHAERDELYEGKINPIASFPGEGIVAFGQKTLQERSSALDRINVRRLLIKVKKYIASTSRYFVFEQNTATTRNKFINSVNPYLEGIQQRQGLYTFRVVMDDSNNTPDVIDRNILVGQIFLQPTKTAEFIVIDFSIVPTGAAFSA